MGAIGDKLIAAGFTGASQRLYVAAAKALDRSDNMHAASNVLADMCTADRGLLVELARFFVSTVSRDMRGPSPESVRGGQYRGADGRHTPAASHGPVEMDGAAPLVPSGHSTLAPSVSPSEKDKAGSASPEGRNRHAASFSPSHDGTGLGDRAGNGQNETARPVVNPPRSLNAMRGINKALSAFDTFKVRGGIAIGDLTLGEARTIAATNEREACILRQLVGKVAMGSPAGATLRELIKIEELDRALGQNMESSDAA